MKNKRKYSGAGHHRNAPVKGICVVAFLLCFSLWIKGQEFRYLKPDTISANIVYLKLKGEEKWSKPSHANWYWRNDPQLSKTIEGVFKEAFQDVDWKQIPALLRVGMFFRFDQTFHIDYVHFIIYRRSFPKEDLLSLEKNFLKYMRLIKKVDLSPYVYTDNPGKFDYGIGRFWLINEKSSVWNEK